MIGQLVILLLFTYYLNEMLKKLDWYIIKKYLGTFALSIVLIISISIIFDLTEKIDNFLDHQAPLKAIVFDYYVNFIPYFANMLTPLFSFIAVIFFTSKMANDSEIIAILSSGVSFNRLLRPYFISSILIAVFAFLLGAYVIPPANKVRLNFEDHYVKKFSSEVARNVQMEVKPGVILYIERYEDKKNLGRHFSLEKYDGKKLISRLTAQTIDWDSTAHWTLHSYMQRDFNGLYESLTRGEKMDTVIDVDPKDFFITTQEAPQMTLYELYNYMDKQKKRGLGNVQAFEDEYIRRFTFPISAIILMLIGVTLSSQKIRGGMGLNIGIGIGLSFTFIFFTTISSTFAIKGNMPILLADWLPNIIFSIIAIYLYKRSPK